MAAAAPPAEAKRDIAINATREEVVAAISAQKGVLFLAPCLVCRVMYCGRDIIAKNSDVLKYGDERGYVPVEKR